MKADDTDIRAFLVSKAANSKKAFKTALTIMLRKDQPVTIGRGKKNDVTLDDKRVSRQHAIIMWEKDHYIIKDFKSVNGTHVNNKRVTSKPLEQGDEIRIGSHEFLMTVLPKPKISDSAVFKKMKTTTDSGFAGDLVSLTLHEIVQVIQHLQKTGLLTITQKVDRSNPALLYFEFGEIVHAQLKKAKGLETAYMIMKITAGTFEFNNDVPSPEKTIQQSTMGILLEACRLQDEQNR
ncbi:FHA domain-containing protein [candidate division CSSED10-310 bacterium]|uniref:FHA domain-containing protein n=1 Tax=candidate division CSSED10-310 bacterium TaxID=2855610 RepID=A0ABV6Z382_UNCC1